MINPESERMPGKRIEKEMEKTIEEKKYSSVGLRTARRFITASKLSKTSFPA